MSHSLFPRTTLRLLASLAGGLLLAGVLPAADAARVDQKVKEIAGSAEFLRSVPKRFATLKAVDAAQRRVTLQAEGEGQSREWPLTPDAEIKVAGWWGRLDQFTAGDRVWAWLKTNRAGKPVAVFMLADEPSAQDIHGNGLTVTASGPDTLTLKGARGKSRVLKADTAAKFRTGARVYVQSAGDRARLLLDPAAFEAGRARQKAVLRKRWLDEGLPGTVMFLHLSGEMELMLDHEAMRWGRSLKPGDSVTLTASPPIRAVVKTARPWRDRTQVRLVVKGKDLADLTVGQRLGLKMPAPPAAVEDAALPPDLGRLTTKKDRVEWFLASIYCPCGVGGDGCTGHFYTLASCNPNACGMPNFMRQQIAARIDKGLSDKQIFEELRKQYGPKLLRPHLAP